MQNFTRRFYIFSGYRKVVLIGMLLTLLLSVNTFSQTNVNQESSDIIIYGDVRVFIDTLEQVTTHGSLTGINGAVIENQGSLVFDINDGYQSVYNYSSDNFFTGNGNYYFNGNADFYTGGDFENAFFNLWLNKTEGSNLFLESNLNVQNRLSLESGHVVTGEDNYIEISSKDSNAVRVANFASMANQSYIEGNLRRHIASGTGYHFPVGLANTYFPVRITNNMEGIEYLDVTFNDLVPLTGKVNIQQALYNFNALNQTGAWKIAGDVNPSSGTMDITGFIFDYIEKPQFETNMFGLVYNSNPQGYEDDWSLEGKFAIPGSLPRLAESDSTQLFGTNKMGYYTIAVADITKLINFISPGGDRETRFIIPSIERYESTELIVYNAMGREIFNAKPYNNDLDMKEFKDGTYYYIFKFTRNGKPGVIQSFIDVKRVY
ncbi:gliding motility-associated C-terminal domain-containing protein [Saccharicrinis sp. FJH62]|uniref:T9SS type B sorting domain-containing protein n=1 Tax=Saccharicrinis sp. FJH62 TaxID=3344657 RepID=UPI0035D477F6